MSINKGRQKVMKRVNALKLRQSLGQVLEELDSEGPILIEKGRRPRAVLISLRDFEERFVDRQARDARRALATSILATRDHTEPSAASVVGDLRALRGPLG